MDSDFVPIDVLNQLQPSLDIQNGLKNIPKNELLRKRKQPKPLIISEKSPSQLTDREKEILNRNIIIKEESEPTLIDSKYHLKKHDLIKFIDYNDGELKSLAEFDENQVLFPTRFPSSRYEVKSLEYTLYKMLNDAGNPDSKMSEIFAESFTDIDNLKDLIYQLDNIYQVIFNELSRQVSSTCKSRGSTIKELMKKYRLLTETVPQELDRLKGEMQENRESDSNLKLKISDFQAAILSLTQELLDVRERDAKVTENAENIQRDLENAVNDSERSKDLLSEYHILYELQRQRLESQMSSINSEKEDWTSLAFALSLKITDESLLTTSKRLRLITKKLIQVSQHFAIFISDCDTQLTSKSQELLDKSLKTITKVHLSINKLTNNFHELFHFIRNKFKEFRENELKTSKTKVAAIKNQIASLKSFLADNKMQLFLEEADETHITVLISDIEKVKLNFEGMLQEIEPVLDRVAVTEPIQNQDNNVPASLQDFLPEFHKLYSWVNDFETHIDIIKTMKPFVGDLRNKINVLEKELSESVTKYHNISDEEIILTDIYPIIEDLYLEAFETPELLSLKKNLFYDQFNRFYGELQRNSTNFSRTIDQYDTGLIEEIHHYQDRITKWLIQVLFLLTDLTTAADIDGKYKRLCQQFEDMVLMGGKLRQYNNRWTETMATKADNLDLKILELNEYAEIDDEWKNVAEMLIKDIGQKIEEELLQRRKQSERMIAEMKFEDVDSVIEDIKSKTTEKDIYLALETVGNLQDEVREAFNKINESNKRKVEAASELADTRLKMAELEQKMAFLLEEYNEYIE